VTGQQIKVTITPTVNLKLLHLVHINYMYAADDGISYEDFLEGRSV